MALSDDDVNPGNPGLRLSCRLEVLPGPTVRDRLWHAVDYGFDAVAAPGRMLDEYHEPLRECRPDSPIPISSLSLGFRGSLLSPDPQVRLDCRDSLLELFDFCAELRIPILNMPPVLIQDNPVRIREPLDYLSAEDRQDELLIDQLPEIGDAARERGVVLVLEPVNRYESEYMNTVDHAARVCDLVGHPNIGMTFDFYHAQMEELNPAAAIRNAGKWLRLVHVAENTRVEPGPGLLDFRPGFRALRDIGYSGCIEMECRRLSGPAERLLPASVDYLRRCWAES
ncbi:MAG: hypothetical protein AUJ92_13470 [Armatimonadetes bacterium CG2_30_59_28]|nr:sugar phosphate isomerase/epimerase [Armatimonadota bacterium]OIO92770.1 MAG: hypothetical protein AUJ92_13470 [Armatimonadetes bacterium CG2_30_59_28]PIU65096.1 MAG: hypothetical protein COS85_10105 [Armatimonadetes bacterium CG07_land_8_20_14_0_80_59_28]PIX38847.1 MAG: hypothetical protein COZ56_19385 [Armatimonadetes bacterium CG_4_8_14_3_um_filter_58_9]PJB61862.1 MAG: hypothetical protein CO095_19850 [Armatimonadetes bacterium CG_4_9_14_3_um_filter_58_7]